MELEDIRKQPWQHQTDISPDIKKLCWQLHSVKLEAWLHAYPLHCILAVCTLQLHHHRPKSHHTLYPTLLCSTVPHDHYLQMYHQPIALLLQCILSDEYYSANNYLSWHNLITAITTVGVKTCYLAGNRPLLHPHCDHICGYQFLCEGRHQGPSHSLCSPLHPERWVQFHGQM